MLVRALCSYQFILYQIGYGGWRIRIHDRQFNFYDKNKLF